MKTCHWHCQHISSVVLSLPIIKKSYLTAPTGNQTQGLRPNVQYQCSGLMLWFNIPCLNGSGQSTGTLINCFNFMIIYDMYIQYFKYIFWYCLNINIFSLMTASSFEYLQACYTRQLPYCICGWQFNILLLFCDLCIYIRYICR